MAENTEKRLRTRQKLADALISLCEQKSYYDVTVQEICDMAQLYRSTFYRYYDTKDAMLREIEHDYLAITQSLTKSMKDFRADASEEQQRVFLKELTADMEYHRQNAKLCCFLLSPAGDLYFHEKMVDSIGRTVRGVLQRRGKKHSLRDTEYLIHYFAAGFIATIRLWLQKDDCTPSEMAAFLLEMMKRFEA